MPQFKLVIGDPKESFFKQNPELEFMSPIKRLIRKVGKKEAGRILWAVYLTEDPNSKFYSMRRERKREEVAKNYLDDPDFNWDEYESIIQEYPNLAMSVEAKNYKRLNDKFQKMLDEVEGSNLKESAAFYSKLSSIYDGLEKAKAMYEEELAKNSEARGSEQAGFFAR